MSQFKCVVLLTRAKLALPLSKSREGGRRLANPG
jgi:hypothetical protein